MSVDPKALAAGLRDFAEHLYPVSGDYADEINNLAKSADTLVTLSQDLTAANERTNAAVDDYNTALAERDAAEAARIRAVTEATRQQMRATDAEATVTKLRAQLEREIVGYVTETAVELMRTAKPGWHYHMVAPDQKDPKATTPIYAKVKA